MTRNFARRGSCTSKILKKNVSERYPQAACNPKNYAKTQKNNTQSPKSSIVALELTRDAPIFMMFSSWNVEMQAWSIGALKVM